MLRYDTVYHIQKKLLSPPIPIPIEGAIRQILLSLTNTRKQNKLKRSQGKGNWAGFRSRRIKREKLELVSVNEEWQAAPRGDELHQTGSGAGTGGHGAKPGK